MRAWARALLFAAVLTPAWEAAGCDSPPAATRIAPTYEATGIIKSFGPNRSYLNIAHDAIPGYMGAMTMSFEPKTPDQLAALSIGDRVRFVFRETQDARRILDSIQTTR